MLIEERLALGHGHVRVISSLQGPALAEALDRRAAAAGVVVRALVEVNLAGEDTKAGISPGELPALLERLASLAALRCVGLMTMPPPAARSTRPCCASSTA